QGDLALTGVGSLEQRTGLISKGLSMFSERPFFGFGLGSFSFQKGVASALSHNDYIQILSEQGIFGLVVFLTILNTYIYKAYISYKNSKDNLWFFLSMIGLSIYLFMINAYDNIFLWTLLAMID